MKAERSHQPPATSHCQTMTDSLADRFGQASRTLDSAQARFVPDLVELILQQARAANASDVHLVPTQDSLNMSWRIDGVLQPIAELRESGPNVVARLKVLAELLTYRTDLPQEGRIRTGNADLEMRVSTFPTMFGEKAVVRLFVGSGQFQRLDDLGFRTDVLHEWQRLLTLTSGVLLITGPAGSGKTTTLYASLREIILASPVMRSLVSLEDPIEAVVPGVAQSQINTAAGFDYARGLRSLLRQDPEVIMVGEIRDREAAETVFQASLTGHLILSTFHAGSTADAISRLCDMHIEPYLLRSGLIGLLSERLLRRLCECSVPGSDPDERLGLEVASWRLSQGCERCGQTGYRSRLPIAELLIPDSSAVGRAILSRTEAAEIELLAVSHGMTTLLDAALAAINSGETSPAEVRRVFGSGAPT